MSGNTINLLQLQWGWITPGTGTANKTEQWDDHLAFLGEPVIARTRRFLFTHCGWWLDHDASESVKNLTGKNPEPNRSLIPAAADSLVELAKHVENGRMEYVAYPYAACVCEATTGEGLLRSLRFSRDVAEAVFGHPPRAALNHDFDYGLEWGTPQMPQIAVLLGFETLVAMSDGRLGAPDGSTVNVIGSPIFKDLLEYGIVRRRHATHALELTNSLRMHQDFERHVNAFPILRETELRAIGLDEYLATIDNEETFDSRRMGAKSWYGGTIDGMALEQNAKQMELRLPAIEALATLRDVSTPALKDELDDFWKKSFILMDNHIHWQCHDYKRHYLPASETVSRDLHRLENDLIGGERDETSSKTALFNPVPWKRDLVVERNGEVMAAKGVQGWGVSIMTNRIENDSDDDPLTLDNGIVRYSLNAKGEVERIDHDSGALTPPRPMGRLIRLKERKTTKTETLKSGDVIKNFQGAASFETIVDLFAKRDRKPRRQCQFESRDLSGTAFLLTSERIDGNGRPIGTEHIPLINLHWGGSGMPRRVMNVAPKLLDVRGAASLRLTMHMISEGKTGPGAARIWLDESEFLDIRRWRGRRRYRIDYAKPTNVKSSVIHSSKWMKKIRFTGKLPDLSYALDATLRRGSTALEYDLTMTFPKPTPLGLSSPPFDLLDGSLLGAQCERPYVPGLLVDVPLPAKSTYHADKPFFIQECLGEAKRTWHTDKRDWWLGMSPFIGMNMAVAEFDAGQLGLLTGGIKHFARWRRGRQESLILSLGASLVHQKTQGFSAAGDSSFSDILRRIDHDPYHKPDFLFAKGTYRFHYALAPAKPGETGRIDLWRRAREFALPPSAAEGSPSDGVSVNSKQVVVTALEPVGKNTVALRLCNLRSAPKSVSVKIPFKIASARMTAHDEPVTIDERAVKLRLKPHAVREVVLDISPR